MGRLLIQLPGTTTAKALTETLSKNVIIVDEDLHQLRLHDGTTAGGHLIGGSSGSGVPVGTIIPFAGNSVPQGYLLCDGSAISRTTYASLFAVIGTIYGTGDGNSTFNLPNFAERSPWWDGNGSNAGVKGDGVLPNITGSDALGWNGRYVGLLTNAGTYRSGCFVSPPTKTSPPEYFANPGVTQVSGTHPCGISFMASNSNGIYGGSYVVPRYCKMGGWIIKY